MNKRCAYMLSVSFFLLLLEICGTLVVSAHSASANTASATDAKSVKLFTAGLLIEKILDTGGTTSNGFMNPMGFYSSFLLAAEDLIVTVTGVNSTDGHEGNISVLTRYIGIKEEKDNNWIIKITENNKIEKNWKTQFVVNEKWNNTENLKFLLAAAQNNKIHILLVNETVQEINAESQITLKWDFSIITGTVVQNTLAAAKITWETNTQVNRDKVTELQKQFKDKELDNIPSNVFVLSTKEKRILFVLQFEKKANDENKITFAVIQLEDDKTTVTFADLKVNKNDCSFKLFTWKTKVMLAKYCGDDSNSMHELQEGGEGWKNTSESISRLLHHFEDKNGFTAIKIDSDENVLLFTQEKKECTNTEGKKDCIDLWMTDGSRLYNVGPIVTSKNKVISAGLLYTKEQLFSLHRETDGSENTIFTHLQEQQKQINSTLEQWKKSNDKVQKICESNPYLETKCTTDGLVGFLSGNVEPNNQWKNEYLGAGATLRGNYKKKDDVGVTFTGAGAGATWPMGNQNDENQSYKFAEYGFTLLATVTIDKNVENKPNSLLGISFGEKEDKFGLWCTADNNFSVSKGTLLENKKSTKTNCTPKTTYQIALILDGHKLTVYVNKEKLTNPEIQITIEQLKSITHFYFGADTKEEAGIVTNESHVTITNILLYNRPFTSDEFTELKPKKNEEEIVRTQPGNESTNPQTSDKNKTETDIFPPNTSATKNETKEAQSSSPSSPPPTTEDSAARVGVVVVLRFMLFGVFTLLGRYVY